MGKSGSCLRLGAMGFNYMLDKIWNKIRDTREPLLWIKLYYSFGKTFGCSLLKEDNFIDIGSIEKTKNILEPLRIFRRKLGAAY